MGQKAHHDGAENAVKNEQRAQGAQRIISRVTKLFLELTPDRVLDAVETAGVRATGRVLQLNSLENRVYDVELEDGRRWVLKFYRPGRWSRGAILDEHAFLAELREAEIPAVAPLDLGGGETLREVEGIFWSAFPRVPGRAPEELGDAELRQVGRLLARMHTVGAARPAAERLHLEPDRIEPAGEKWIPLEFASRYARAVGRIRDAVRPLFDGVPMHRIHGDCHPGNLLQNRDGFFFVDFDDMVTGPAAQDVWLLEHDSDRRDKIIEGYGEMRAFDRAWLRLCEPLRALRIVRYSAWIASHWTDPAFPRVFSDFLEFDYWQRETEELERIAAML